VWSPLPQDVGSLEGKKDPSCPTGQLLDPPAAVCSDVGKLWSLDKVGTKA